MRTESTASSTRGSAAARAARSIRSTGSTAGSLVVLVDLAVADEYRRSGIDGHDAAFLVLPWRERAHRAGMARRVASGHARSRDIGDVNSRRSRSIGRSRRQARVRRRAISRVCSPGIGAGRSGASAMRRNGRGMGLGGHRLGEQRVHHVGVQPSEDAAADRRARRPLGSSDRRAPRPPAAPSTTSALSRPAVHRDTSAAKSVRATGQFGDAEDLGQGGAVVVASAPRSRTTRRRPRTGRRRGSRRRRRRRDPPRGPPSAT